MRLLQFNPSNNGTDAQQSAHIAAQISNRPGTYSVRAHPARRPSNTDKSEVRVFPLEGNTVRKPAQHEPLDLENLQHRVATLEKRIKARAADRHAAISSRELEELKQRLLILERNINSELWAAKQREYTMLEILARPALKTRIMHGITHTASHRLPAIGRWFKEAAVEWFEDVQPGWWPTFAAAWQESLDKARGISPG